jgi:hypothetical protein
MRQYVVVSGLIFAVVAVAQLVRVVMAWPVHIGSFDAPNWVSGIAVLIAGSLAIWAFRVRRADRTTP